MGKHRITNLLLSQEDRKLKKKLRCSESREQSGVLSAGDCARTSCRDPPEMMRIRKNHWFSLGRGGKEKATAACRAATAEEVEWNSVHAGTQSSWDNGEVCQ